MLKIDESKRVGLIVCASCFVLNLILTIICNFQQMHNDYWDLLFMAKNIDFSDPKTLFNQCTTSGYPLLLHILIKSKSDILLPTIINIFCGTLTSIIIFLYLNKLIPSVKEKIYASILYVFFPINFLYFNQGGGDPLAIFFFTIGTFLIIEHFFLRSNGSFFTFFLNGILIGIATFLRPHVLISSLLLIVLLITFQRKKIKEVLSFGSGIFFIYSFQVIINLLSGHKIFETKLGSPLIYSLMYGNNWFKTSTENLSLTTLEIIKMDVLLFIKKYLTNFIKYFFFCGLFPLLVTLITKNKKIKSISLFLTIFILIYVFFFSAFFSRRMPLLIIPFTMFCFGILINEILEYCKKTSDVKRAKIIKIGLYSFIAIFTMAILVKDAFYFKMRYKESKTFIEVENYLKANGCTSAFETFTTDFNFYFRSFPEHTPHINGGWSRIGTYKFNDIYPEMSVSSLNSFIEDCKKHNIKFLILTKDAYLLMEDIGKIYSFNTSHPSILFKKEIDRFRIFEII